MMDSNEKRQSLMHFAQDKRGATAIEYAFFSALIGIVLTIALGQVYNAMDKKFDDVSTVTERVNQQLDEGSSEQQQDTPSQ